MYEEPEAMREIHEIRETLYEEEKHLSRKEKVAKIRKEAEEFKQKHGISFRKHHVSAN